MKLTGTYRLQLHAGFGFNDAEKLIPYLADLGISHVYLSPILQAVEGSQHGYDVLNHSLISTELGGREGFESLAIAAHTAGLGIVVDTVPNHMAFPAPESLNRPLWKVLQQGRPAPTARWFDVDWEVLQGRLGIPILGDPLESAIHNRELTIEGDPPVLRYHEHVFPLVSGTDTTADLRTVLAAQPYRLAHWRDRGVFLNYRRFFEVDSLIAVRVEDPDVFEATHAVLLQLHRAGHIDGFRIDHPDGLADPEGYLDTLDGQLAKKTPVWVEKIIQGDEALPTSWKSAGTTGYDAIRVIQAALTDPLAAPVLESAWAATGGETDLEACVLDAKRQVVTKSLVPEVARLTRRAKEALPGSDPERLREAVVELLVSGDVYRAYLRPGEAPSDDALRRLAAAFSKALLARPDLEAELGALMEVCTLQVSGEAARDFAVRLQQTWGPVMAKGIEDTAFYRYHRLTALNEVGGEPADLTADGVALLHAWAARQQREWPRGMTALSTHDTKRSEDVRARLLAVAGDTDAWAECSGIARSEAEGTGLDAATAHLVWQTLLGVGEIDSERLANYLVKAVKEAKQQTAWIDGDQAYEERVVAFGEAHRASGRLHAAIERALAANAEAIRAVTLGQKALALTLPGVPDTYQGCETLDLSLVDPDNRRPVDYTARAALLAAVDAGTADGLAAEKLLVSSRVLRLRRQFPSLFGKRPRYLPLTATSEHALGFVRKLRRNLLPDGQDARTVATLVTRAPARLSATGGWGEHTVKLPKGEWRDVLTGRITTGGDVRLADLLEALPVAVLVR